MSGHEKSFGGAAIAIVGMAGRFPGARNVRELWKNLRAGVESTTRFKPDELEDAFDDDVRNSPSYVPVRSILDDVDMFDAEFFGMRAREAAVTDPQHRTFLEICWEALEDAGHDPTTYKGAIGVFAGAAYNSYLIKHVLSDRRAVDEFTSNFQVGSYEELIGSLQDVLATRVAYKLDLKGPAVNVQSCCSTSLLAVAQACQSLLLFQSDTALAGGVSISFPQKRGYVSLEGGMVSADGHCRPFDAQASGTVFGSGAGVVVLKRLDDAVADGDTIYAVIRGFGVNNDGAQKVGFTAPSIDGQAEVIVAALAMADVDAGSIGFVECHGTATPLGDPIEFKGLVKAFRASTDKRNFCALGSTKANFGHLDAAAGVAGLIKATLALKNAEIPPLVHFKTPNPALELESSPFKFNSELVPWAAEGPRRAGVSAFGVGGTNIHLVLEEAPPVTANARAETKPQIFPLSARNAEAVTRMASNLAGHLETSTLDIADTAHTLQHGRRVFDHRAAVVASSAADAATKLRAATPRQKTPTPKIVFMFPGQGAQYPGMGRGLYETEAVFRRHVDAGAKVLKAVSDVDLVALLYDDVPADDDAPHPIRSTVLAQPALFVVEYATAQLLMSRGIEPAAMIGHSLGEFVAACLAGVLSFDDALKLVAARGRLMQDQPPGAMLAVRGAESRVAEFCTGGAEIAAVNAPALSVVSGPFDAIAALEAKLDAAEISHRRLHTSHAFHSAMMDGVVEALKKETANLRLAAPKRPYVSAVTGTWVRAEEATSPDYWARHCRATVRFAPALATLLEDKDLILVEVGPGRTLSTFAAQAKNKAGVRATIATLPEFADRGDECTTFAEALAGLWCEGALVEWPRDPARKRVSLPTYAFTRKRHWIEAPAPQRGTGSVAPQVDVALPEVADCAVVALPQTVEPTPEPVAVDRPAQLRGRIQALLEELSGESLEGASHSATFVELGFDSLFLGQVVKRIQKVYGVKIAFRQLMRDYPSIEALADHLMKTAKPEALPAASAAPAKTHLPGTAGVLPALGNATPPQSVALAQTAAGSGIESLQSQLVAMQQLISQQLQTLQTISAAAPTAAQAPAPKPAAPEIKFDDATPSRFAMYKPGAKSAVDGMSPAQRRFIDDLVAKYAKKAPTSKQRTQDARDVLADPRSASGFRAEWKEMVFPIVSPRSKGSRIWDVDGNEYVDLVNGFGQTMFGHAPDFVVEAVARQLRDGFAIGPQSPLAGEVARLFAEMTGNERVTFCNTGSEAVMAAIRVARTVTGREKVVVFGGAYHGMFDEVLVKPAAKGDVGALPVAPGIPQESVDNMIVLPYATPESLAWVRANADEIAAVIAETVQSRHPNLLPREFLAELREITQASGTALVFDEVVTGFRVHPGGMQALFDIRADMATYGKVVGGGMPVGVLAGKAEFMDALDGGFWSFGDDSVPETAPTFFAGTFVRHPLTLAACRAVLLHLKENGPKLQQDVAAKAKRMADEINVFLAERGVKTRLETFSSWCYANFSAEDQLATLFYAHMRLLGVHVLEGFPWFVTTTHTDADIDFIVRAAKQSIDALQAAGILASQAADPHATGIDAPSRVSSAPTAPVARAKGSIRETAWIEAPLTEAQTEIWLAAELSESASCAFNESVTLTLDGKLDADALTGALDDVVARHDALRASIAPSGEVLRIAPALKLHVPLIDVSQASDRDARLNTILDDEARTPFDLAAGPLCRARLLRLGAQSHALVFTAHHIICDGWSMSTVMSELGLCYAARLDGTAPDLPETLPFHRYALERHEPKPEDARIEQFWLSEFADLPPMLDLPTDRPRPAVKSFRGATYTDHLDAALVAAVKKAGGRYGASLFASLFAAMQVTLGKLGGQRDIALTVPMAGQTLIEDEVLVGHCVDFLPVRAVFDETAPLGVFLDAVKTKLLAAMDHQGYTYGTLVHKLGVRRDPNRTPITDVQFNLEKFGTGLEFAGLKASAKSNPKAFVNFDLFFNMTEGPSGIRIDVDYSTDLYDEGTIKRWIGHLRTFLLAMAQDPTRAIADYTLLNEADVRWLVDDLNATAAPYPRDALVHELVAAQAAKTPDAVAFTCNDVTLTYAALEDRANHLARRLAALVPDSRERIAVALPRGLDLPVALLAVLKSGNAYVPLDPTHPPARLTQTLDAADVVAIVCADDAMAELATGIEVVRLDRPLPGTPIAAPKTDRRPDAASTAYVIFTSGSTGTPKGVEVSHRALVNFLYAMASAPGFTREDVIVAVTTVSFDIAGLELFLPLLAGGRAIIADREQVRSGTALVQLVKDAPATVLQATPSLWRLLLEAGLQPGAGLKMLCGGEPLPRDLANRLASGGGELWNVYGPTETTIWSSAGRVEPGDGAITIGAPIANTQIHVLDARDALVPVGVTGDVYIGGDGLARGYFNRPDLTAAAFREVRIAGRAPQRLYRTGDVGRRRADGGIQLLGRKDQQVKLRGYRIELEDIEAHLRRAPGLLDAAVAVQAAGEGDARLVGYYVTADTADISSKTLARHMSARLPDYMVPTVWRRLDALPQTANGKLDRKALPALEFDGPPAAAQRDTIAARGVLEEAVAQIWADLLKREDVGAETHFFEAGGHSLLAMRMIARLQVALGRPVTIAELFRAPRLGDFVNLIAAANGDADANKVIRIQPNGLRTPVIVLNNAWNLFPLSKALGPDQPVVSLQLVDRAIKAPKKPARFGDVVDEAVRLIRKAQPHGPYVLLGHCVLGSLALEAARRLKQDGETVDLVAMLDAEPNLKFKGIALRRRLHNYWMLQGRRLRWYAGLYLDGSVNLLYVAARYGFARRLGFVALAEALGLKQRWYEQDFHTQHVVDGWMAHTSTPYDGDVVLYHAMPHDRTGFLDRLLPWVPSWKSIIGSRLVVQDVKIAHAEMFREPGAAIIGGHLARVLEALRLREKLPSAAPPPAASAQSERRTQKAPAEIV